MLLQGFCVKSDFQMEASVIFPHQKSVLWARDSDSNYSVFLNTVYSIPAIQLKVTQVLKSNKGWLELQSRDFR